MFFIVSHFRRSLIFTDKEISLARKYWMRVKVADSDKHSSLLQFRIDYGRKNFTVQGPFSQHYIFIVTYESAQITRVLHNTRQERLAND